jgi:hypothetical protein
MAQGPKCSVGIENEQWDTTPMQSVEPTEQWIQATPMATMGHFNKPLEMPRHSIDSSVDIESGNIRYLPWENCHRKLWVEGNYRALLRFNWEEVRY